MDCRAEKEGLEREPAKRREGEELSQKNAISRQAQIGGTRRAFELHEGDEINEKAFKALIRAAVALNTSKRATARPVRPLKKPKSA